MTFVIAGIFLLIGEKVDLQSLGPSTSVLFKEGSRKKRHSFYGRRSRNGAILALLRLLAKVSLCVVCGDAVRDQEVVSSNLVASTKKTGSSFDSPVFLRLQHCDEI
jgi:hypothetical protein